MLGRSMVSPEFIPIILCALFQLDPSPAGHVKHQTLLLPLDVVPCVPTVPTVRPDTSWFGSSGRTWVAGRGDGADEISLQMMCIIYTYR